jgi:hypothetical protein
MAFTILTQGTFTSTGASQRIPVQSSADYFVVKNLTQLATTQTTGRGVMFEWFSNPGMADYSAYMTSKTNSTNALNYSLITTGGFLYVKTYPYSTGPAANAITAITNANPAVVSQVNTYTNNDIVNIYNTTGMLQTAGIPFQISSVSGTGYTLLGLPATIANGFASAGTGGNTRFLSTYAAVEPEFLYITGISQGAQAVISTSIDPAPYYVVGQKIHFSIPDAFGMEELNQQTAVITAINGVSASGSIGAYNITVNVNTSAFTAFAFPSSALIATGGSYPTLSSAGQSAQKNILTGAQTGYEVTISPFHSPISTPYMFLSGGTLSPAGSAGDVILYQIWKGDAALYN